MADKSTQDMVALMRMLLNRKAPPVYVNDYRAAYEKQARNG